MPTHYIMISFDDFGNSRDKYRNYLSNKAGINNGAYTLVTFEELETNPGKLKARLAVQNSAGNKLKLLLHGHGDGVHDSIHNDGHTASRNGDQLAVLIAKILKGSGRAASAANASETLVVMLSCLYGTAQHSDLKQSNAWKLHGKLKANAVFVELNARTEIVVQSKIGIEQKKFITSIATNVALSTITGRKIPFGKVLCSYATAFPHNREIHLIDSVGQQKIAHDSLTARRLIWTLDTLSALVLYANDSLNNANHKRVLAAVFTYDQAQIMRPNQDHDPEFLKQILQYLAGSRVTLPTPTNMPAYPFITKELEKNGRFKHRNIGFLGFHTSEPDTTIKILGLVANYPN